LSHWIDDTDVANVADDAGVADDADDTECIQVLNDRV
jgi:hypothetical protein